MDEKSPLFAVLVASILLLLAAAPGLADTVTVPGGSQDAIQDAVDQAGAGGTVVLSKGDHVVSETVFLRQNGVRIVGKNGSEILVTGDIGTVFSITASHAELSGVRVWVSTEIGGDVTFAEADEADYLDMNDCRGEGVVQLVSAVDSSDVSIRNNRVEASAPREDPDVAVIDLEGGGSCTVSKNRLSGPRTTGTAGISVATVARSTFEVSGNRIEGFDTGIAADGEGAATIRKNRIRGSINGMILGLTTTVFGWEISKNRVDETLAAGIYLEDGEACRVAWNRVVAAGTDGINVGGIQVQVTRNACRLNAGAGIYVEATNCEISHCQTHRNGRGVRVVGSSNRLHKMRAKKNTTDGIVSTPASEGALGNVDAGGNRASLNGGVQISIT